MRSCLDSLWQPLQLVAKEVLHCGEIVRDMIRQTREKRWKNEEKERD